MPAASLETTLELWSTTLRQAKHRMRPLFAAPSVAASANAFLDGLLGPERRKTGWMRAEAAGDPGPWRQQAILGRSYWNADALRDVVRDHVIETLGAPESLFGNILNLIKRLWFKGNGLSRGEVADVDDREPCAVRPQQTAVSERFDG